MALYKRLSQGDSFSWPCVEQQQHSITIGDKRSHSFSISNYIRICNYKIYLQYNFSKLLLFPVRLKKRNDRLKNLPVYRDLRYTGLTYLVIECESRLEAVANGKLWHTVDSAAEGIAAIRAMGAAPEAMICSFWTLYCRCGQL